MNIINTEALRTRLKNEKDTEQALLTTHLYYNRHTKEHEKEGKEMRKTKQIFTGEIKYAKRKYNKVKEKQ